MKKLGLLLVVILLVVSLSGCAMSRMTTTRTAPDGTVTVYEVAVKIFGQDLEATDFSATLDPEGKTKVKAGAAGTTTSEVTTDTAMAIVEALKVMLPYMVAPAPPAP